MTETASLYLLDTNIVVQYVRGSELSKEIESRFNLLHRTERPLISVVSIGELEALARRLGWGSKKIQALENHLRELVVVDISSQEVLKAYGEISSWTEDEGKRMGQQNDLWIAATAHASGAHLITADSDFDVLDARWISRTFIPQDFEGGLSPS